MTDTCQCFLMIAIRIAVVQQNWTIPYYSNEFHLNIPYLSQTFKPYESKEWFIHQEDAYKTSNYLQVYL